MNPYKTEYVCGIQTTQIINLTNKPAIAMSLDTVLFVTGGVAYIENKAHVVATDIIKEHNIFVIKYCVSGRGGLDGRALAWQPFAIITGTSSNRRSGSVFLSVLWHFYA